MGISREDYINNKKNFLEIRADLVSLLEKLKMLKEIRAQKASIYRMLSSSYGSFSPGFSKLKKELPHIRVQKDPEDKVPIKHLDVGAGSNDLRSELESIQAKLEELNALK